jgi:hypothetical protein
MPAQRQFHSPQTKPAPPPPKPEERNERPHELTEAGTVEVTISDAARRCPAWLHVDGELIARIYRIGRAVSGRTRRPLPPRPTIKRTSGVG